MLPPDSTDPLPEPPERAVSEIPTPDALSTPVAWADSAGTVLGVNAAFARWLGVSQRRLVGRPLAALEMDGDAMARFLRNTDRDLLRLHRVALGFPGGAARFAEGWLSRADAGGWLLEAHPVDDFPALDPAQAMPSALAAALRGLAHELRNPLAGLKGAAQLLSRRAQNRADNEDERALIGLIESEAERLNALLDRLLSPTSQRPHAALNIHAVLERVLRLAEAEGAWHGRLQRDYDPSLPELHGDADRLTQAVWNLVGNAMQAGAALITLRTRVEHGLRIHDQLHARALRLEIIDDGRGVPEELAEHLFLPLVSGRAEGSGLGLALAQQVAREHRGSLGFRSRPGHTVFTLLLPQSRDAAEEGRHAH
ncbi:PAS domain-containing sensor histidine kinase [Pseudoxanthomonas winnipegensis]|uniref:Sensory histidine kinase/phosphatase NtrB n=1 Tax=Pseudoxanthomonas winnipegensis TaxID=2480810 RepID=A0A4Q8LCA3_9GAMM|nr:ATP-binding protein [Pseudoxanthomonas winnipegensis]RZZ83213.1 PAS domain-containing sensor histidine kinase [Pseudoxanthomonas winnipegensis]TAA26188.1 PAS domain-containing sensor histidine kinase [Pseudoxanthomonas winnipegensis]TAA39894.1 PAS domain-containing sensor histidine kinase [Pseudoxanthomonas winnipegensis]TBV72632.1 PAS domain-containing sensor histidine kinase [Pseudoxanthomonas winnipegensis]